ncbi:purine nucleoside phosphorylase [Claveliimonas bilis]|uniref:purine-nucleoside phosphorylase n=1 Tax=Claveliimonas bilis TaxID=3028070 RepID=UPI002930D6AA|nr:purine-nucleoside phosphorylase [Claveliimonas bilis]BDZ83582.1 purine nucleoside phosphorylase [Claveliimonas bilis]
MRPYERLLKCREEIRKRTDFRPQVGIVLGSGLGGYADNMEISCEIPYREIPGFPVSTVQGHDGKFLFGYVKNTPVILMKGRVHYYEGYPMEDVVLPVRLMGLLGADTVILTNAAGGINRTFQAGDLMLITDHISIAVPNPLRGENIDELGTRFPDMSHVYDPELQEAAKKTAARQGISLREGIYVQCSGPSYETPAEIRMLGALGADAVGMSTVCEAIAARHMGMKVCGISCITNMAAGILDQPLDHREVQKSADQAKEKFENLITGLVGK